MNQPTHYDWDNPDVIARNRLPRHGSLVPYVDVGTALAGDQDTADVVSLNGTWIFQLYPNPDAVPEGFFTADYDVTDWSPIKVPGKAWLEFQVGPEGEGSRLAQTATFAPYGVWGNLYWYALYPLHKLIFSDMIKAVARDAVKRRADTPVRHD